MELTSTRCLLGFAAWTVLHVGYIVGARVVQIARGRKASTFPSGQIHEGSPLYQRVLRSHSNCLENLPLFAIVVILNKVLGAPNIDGLSQIYLGARIGQSVAHVASGSEMAINVRAAFFLIQHVVLILAGIRTLPSTA